MISFAYCILYVSDVSASLCFFEKVFDCTIKFITPDNSYGELLTGATTLAFASNTLAVSNLKNGFTKPNLANKPQAFEIAFTTDNVQRLFKKAIKHGAIAEAPPVLKPHGQMVSYVRDLNGFLIEICSPVH
jgi:lactoylglutathione lyase